MMLDYNKLIGKRVKLLCVFPGIKQSIYYDGVILESSEANKVILILDRFGKRVHIDTDTIKQLVEL